MHIILDGVFNHVSDDSIYFDRYYKFLPDAAEKYGGKIGAYPYWAYVYDYMSENGVYSYEGWWGYDSMPVIKSTNGSEYQTGKW